MNNLTCPESGSKEFLSKNNLKDLTKTSFEPDLQYIINLSCNFGGALMLGSGKITVTSIHRHLPWQSHLLDIYLSYIRQKSILPPETVKSVPRLTICELSLVAKL